MLNRGCLLLHVAGTTAGGVSGLCLAACTIKHGDGMAAVCPVATCVCALESDVCSCSIVVVGLLCGSSTAAHCAVSLHCCVMLMRHAPAVCFVLTPGCCVMIDRSALAARSKACCKSKHSSHTHQWVCVWSCRTGCWEAVVCWRQPHELSGRAPGLHVC